MRETVEHWVLLISVMTLLPVVIELRHRVTAATECAAIVPMRAWSEATALGSRGCCELDPDRWRGASRFLDCHSASEQTELRRAACRAVPRYEGHVIPNMGAAPPGATPTP